MDCGLMVLQGNEFWWEDTSCLAQEVHNKAVAPICQWYGCPANWVEFNGHCYMYSSTSASWENAEAACVFYGGHLASVHSKAENDFIQQLISDWTWIGASDINTEVRMVKS